MTQPFIIPFQTTDWSTIPITEHPGETGKAFWQTLQFEGFRIRMVEYTPGYKADYWGEKGRIISCVSGEMTSELGDKRAFVLKQGMTYVVTDEASSHRSTTDGGAKLFIIDGDFLKK
ncbi:MAG: hypothetical protein EXS67_05445 [Candidatus Margulisbacteria bacterium]|nr:hypothetical protein [Candidatus Margulisiibacteriota bacterium]